MVKHIKILKSHISSILEQYTSEISTKINEELKQLNSDIFYAENRISPTISFRINSKNKWMYDFKTKNDTGTGAAFRGLILLDLVVLHQTQLPAIAHDSFLFTDIENSTVCQIIKIYNLFKKQIFVSLTDKSTYNNSETSEIIKKSEVLSLSANGNELFGENWKVNKK